VAQARPFPFQDAKIAPRPAVATGDLPRRHEDGDGARATPPVLARIPDVAIGPRRIDPPSPNNRAADSAVRYRFDSSHLSTAGDVTTRLRKSRQAAKEQSSDSGLEKLSATIRFGVKAWEFVQNYPAAIRAVGMFLLTAAAGTSMMLLMGHRPEQGDAPSATQPTPTAASSEPAPSATEAEHDSSGATTLIPTAIGPSASAGRAPERIVAPATASPSTAVDVKFSPSEPLPRFQIEEAAVTPHTGSAATTTGGYPTTSFLPTKMPGLESEPLPRAQTTEPAVARFSGNIEPLSR
jgi:hypothetical protein